jgi:hypothetical protein
MAAGYHGSPISVTGDCDGKWRKITIKLDPPAGLPKLIVHAKEGYFAAKL